MRDIEEYAHQLWMRVPRYERVGWKVRLVAPRYLPTIKVLVFLAWSGDRRARVALRTLMPGGIPTGHVLGARGARSPRRVPRGVGNVLDVFTLGYRRARELSNAEK